MFYDVLKVVAVPIIHAVWAPEPRGLEHVPQTGPVILASNHLAACDTVFMPSLVPRTVHFLGKVDFFHGGSPGNRLLGLLLRLLGVTEVNRSGGSASQRAIDAGIEVLEAGNVLGIYPEGTRSPDGRLYRGRTGAVRMALATGAPIVPVAMLGTFEAQRGRTIVPRRHPRTQAVFGAPLDAAALAEASGQQEDGPRLRAVTDSVMEAIARLSGQERANEYAADAKRRLAAGD